MVYTYYIDTKFLNSDDLQGYTYFLNKEEKQKFNYFKVPSRKLEFLVGRLIIKYFISLFFSVKPQDITISYNNYGKPYYNSFYFNLSHSKGIIVISFSFFNPIGVDVECLDNAYNAFTESIYTENEKIMLNYNFFKINKELEFIYTWTLKEALVKSLGTGFIIPPNKLDTTYLIFQKELYSKYVYYVKNYVITLVSRNNKRKDEFSELKIIDLDTIKKFFMR
ncbi:4'-phosphopantetheinyl transferase family protein [Staphylococcus gallinarum]|uniref:4'-phosphopantetheinyl transferase family protein n=1 Tax=Staphylococcus gallinarum TaxID=1293 RepID=UPI002DBC1F86|nr:4'-phosphopantetheinyl transferase superfamily protein [Staphylococcus gallinarum]MEB7040090.1 4'-phosphopantetheinyl transferase superfamily protein [Staphylococcus gallinarum]